VSATSCVMVFACGAARAQGVDTTCELVLTKTDPSTVNVAYPDEAAIYWSGHYAAVPGTRIRITGRFPHARYMSFNVYDNAQRPLDAVADVELAPDPGSSNPFAPGASRTVSARSYTAFIDFGPVPAKRAPNTLYTGTGQNGTPNESGSFIYRVYIPDRGRDETGGVGLPTVTLESTSSGSRPSDSACAGFSKPPVPGVNQAVAGADGPPVPASATAPGNNPPHWVKFKNLVQVANETATDNPFFDSFTGPASAAEPLGGQGAFLSNLHNAYVYTALNRAYGEVSLTRMRAPTFPDTRGGPPVMPSAQLRYFSLCTNEIASQRYIACASDDRSVRDASGFVDYIVSTPSSRPFSATAACGYTWLPFGPSSEDSLIVRHMLPDARFSQAIQRAQPGAEARTMGDYLPSTRYLKAGEQLPCRALPVSAGPRLGLPVAARHRCTSRRVFVIHLPWRGLRSASIFVAGHRIRVLRGRRLRGVVSLRGLPLGRYPVRIVARTRSGRRLVALRTYRTCTPRRS